MTAEQHLAVQGELAANRRQAVPVVLGDEWVGLAKVKGDGLHIVDRVAARKTAESIVP